MYAYCTNNPVVYLDPDGLCREVGALLTKIDCGSITCVTSAAFRSYANSIDYADSYGAYVGTSLATAILDWYYGTPGYGDFEGTVTVGVSYSNTSNVGGAGSVGICIDGQGNIGLVASGTAVVGTPAKGLSAFTSITDAPNITKLGGTSAQIGGSVSLVGAEAVYFRDSTTNELYSGVTCYIDLIALFTGRAPQSAEGHLSASWSNVQLWDNVRN